MWTRVAAAIVFILLPTALHAQEKRIALLIGNKDYKAGVGALINPLNDIRIVSEALRAIGFEVLKPMENAQRSAMLLAIHAFATQLKAAGPNAVGFLYYSGHGIASAGENYLIPTDVDEPSTVLLAVQGVEQSEVLAILRNEAPNAAHYLVLDACRNTLAGARGGKGFIAVVQQSGVLVAFAAEPGKTASDVGQGSGPYAAALATELVKPAQNDLLMFHNVRVAVMDKTNGDQVPWTEDGIQRRQRVLFGGEGKPISTSPARLSEAAEAWAAAKDTTSIAVLDAFIVRFKSTFYADLAQARIEELKKKSAMMVPAAAVAVDKADREDIGAFPRRGFGRDAEQTDASLQTTLLWRILKRDFPDWYAERLKVIVALKAENKDDVSIAQQVGRDLVQLRRQQTNNALAASIRSLKRIASIFRENIAQLRKESIDACFAYISQGEASPVIVPLMLSSPHAMRLQIQLVAIFEAAADGRKLPQVYAKPRKTDYETLASALTALGWSQADMQVFSDERELARAAPEKICQLVHDWYRTQLELKDPDVQLRLLVDSLRPVVAG